MARKRQATEPVEVVETETVQPEETTQPEIDGADVDEVMLETEVLDEVVTPDEHTETVTAPPATDPLAMQVTNHGSRYWDAVNKAWIETGYNFLNFENEIKKTKLINNLIQVNALAGYDRFEWVA